MSDDNREIYEALKEKAPSTIRDLQAIFNLGIPKDEILAKLREVKRGEIPDFLWAATDLALDYMIEQRRLFIEKVKAN